MTAFPPASLVVQFDAQTIGLWKDAGRTQPAIAGDAVVAIGDSATGLGPFGSTFSVLGSITLGSIGTKKALQFPTGSANRVSITPAAGFAQYGTSNGTHAYAVVYFYPAETAGSTREIFGMLKSGENTRERIFGGSDGTLSVARRGTSGAQVLSIVENVVTKNQAVIVFVRHNGTTKDVWIDKGDGAGAIRVLTNAPADASGTEAFDGMFLGGQFGFHGAIGHLTSWEDSSAVTDQDVLDTMARLRTDWPVVAAIPVLTLNEEAALRVRSYQDPTMPLSGTVADLPGLPAKVFRRVLRVADNSEVLPYADTGATFTGSTYAGGISLLPATPGTYVQDLQVRAADGTPLVTYRSLSFIIALPVVITGSSTGERAGTEGSVAPDPLLWLYNGDSETVWRPGSSVGRGVAAIGAAMRPLLADIGMPADTPIAVINAARGGTTLQDLSRGSLFASLVQPIIERLRLKPVLEFRASGANDSFKTYFNVQQVESRIDHQAKHADLTTRWNTLLGVPDLPLVLVGMNNRLFDTDQPIGSDGSGRATLGRGGEIAHCLSRSRAIYVSTLDCTVTSGDIHLTDNATGSGRAFTRAGLAAIKVLSGPQVGRRFHPYFVSVEQVSDGLLLNANFTSGATFGPQPVAGWSGIRVYDNGTGTLIFDSETASGPVVTHSATQLKIPIALSPGVIPFVEVMTGTWSKPQENLPKDNNGLVFESTISGVGQVQVGGQRITVRNT